MSKNKEFSKESTCVEFFFSVLPGGEKKNTGSDFWNAPLKEESNKPTLQRKKFY